jgi:hypothetical protein
MKRCNDLAINRFRIRRTPQLWQPGYLWTKPTFLADGEAGQLVDRPAINLGTDAGTEPLFSENYFIGFFAELNH